LTYVGKINAEQLPGAVGPFFASGVGCACPPNFSTSEDLIVLNADAIKDGDPPCFVVEITV